MAVSAGRHPQRPELTRMQTAGEILRTYGREKTMNKRDTTGPIDQDVEGHRIYSSSDRTIKDHVEPVAWEDPQGDNDTERRN